MTLTITSSRKPPKSKKKEVGRKKKETMTGFLKRWGMPPYIVKMGKKGLRYANPPEKGVYWYWFSLAIRLRDVTRFASCISCGRLITVDTSDCGHFIPASQCGPELLFDPRNNNAECSHCNAWDDLHLLGYARTLDKRYGEGTAEDLLKRHREYRAGPVIKDFKAVEYVKMIERLKEKGL